MKLVYIVGALGPTERQRREVAERYECESPCISPRLESQLVHVNITRATALALRVAKSGHMPVCRHTNTGDPRFSELTPEFRDAGNMKLLSRCDAIALVDGWDESEIACREVIEARRLDKSVWDAYDNGRLCYITPGYELKARTALCSRSARAPASLEEKPPTTNYGWEPSTALPNPTSRHQHDISHVDHPNPDDPFDCRRRR